MITNADDRHIDWATRHHRTHVRKTTATGRSLRCKSRSHHFVHCNADADVSIDLGDVKQSLHVLGQGRHWNDRRRATKPSLHGRLGR